MKECTGPGLREGFTTGASAAAAAGAAALLLFRNERLSLVTVSNLQGRVIAVPVASVVKTGECARAVVIKDGGDDPDVTSGLEIVVDACRGGEGISLRGGKGIGIVTKPGLQVPAGEPAINPVPREMIKNAVAGLVPPGEGLTLTVSVPRGEEVARKTLNSRLGISGGISILGTTGIVRPMSEEAFKNSLVPLIQMAVAHGYKAVVLTPGRTGYRFAVERYGLPPEAVVEMSNFVGFMLEACVERGVEKVMLWGHHGKLVKVAAGIFHTHNRVADARLETIAAYAGALGASRGVIAAVLDSSTAEGALGILGRYDLLAVYTLLARQASRRAAEYVRGKLAVGTVLLGMDGNILGMDERALDIGGCLGWRR
ncbi:MAG: cobalamin biosynthesis protein CbiD [Peptococcaceae bacterium]|nr:MAG: cobalamin biosynthesis protein CbiD [Peptococcaceae bacterium]